MGLVSSNIWLTAFSAGTIFGVTSTYLFIKFARNIVVPKPIPMEERFEVREFKISIRHLRFSPFINSMC